MIYFTSISWGNTPSPYPKYTYWKRKEKETTDEEWSWILFSFQATVLMGLQTNPETWASHSYLKNNYQNWNFQNCQYQNRDFLDYVGEWF